MRCLSADRCRARDERGNPAECDGPLCFWCLESSERDVRALVLDYRDLEQHLPPSLGQRGSGLPTGRGGLPRLPISEHVLDLQFDIRWLSTAWEDVVRDAAGLSMTADWSKRRRDGVAVDAAVRVLAPRLDVLARVECADMWAYPGSEGWSEVPGWQGVLDLARLHHRARHALGLTAAQREHCNGVSCKRCDLKLLYRVPAEDAVQCDGCNLWYDGAGYAEWVALLAASAPRNVVPS